MFCSLHRWLCKNYVNEAKYGQRGSLFHLATLQLSKQETIFCERDARDGEEKM
jgi:hypothetical protein